MPLFACSRSPAAVADRGVDLRRGGLRLDLVQPLQAVNTRGDGGGVHTGGHRGHRRRGLRGGGQAQDGGGQPACGDCGESELLHFLSPFGGSSAFGFRAIRAV
ncbi:hypothetical protein MSMEI_6300 [Mycolicibacterium smegmatis MC2 155]|uniref:Uncharacterized protein n=1 Tax=Mycolicibacterium smegmatis (strain ATCC 700084 / mc(2)155) TaxID=246196 RepID=I7GFT7_MYCS2|nr:hypothetical protein MSMEI_6300 [Mycolicibacterium smegmatis MC2 155]